MSDLLTSSSADASSSYTVLARRYRSRDFDELIGQEPIARTLQNAIANDRAAHAYLFCGTRGVGKTSMARIFAKALNVSDDLNEKEAIAEAILRGDDLDVIEIDGASNRGVNEARDLIAGAGLSPARCRYKIYIIDEVHMLTREAFNALLKTMEEPPSHVKFILCTTEPHKVPATIQSRCQRFDFRPIASRDIASQVRTILDSEGIEAPDSVVQHIARLGRGSMRDALSLLDRVLAAGETSLTHELLESMLGLPNQALIVQIVEAIVDGDAASALQAGATLVQQGVSVEQAVEQLVEYFRALLIIATCGADSDLLEVTDDVREAAVRQANSYEPAALVHNIALCDAVQRVASTSVTAQALFEALLVRLALAGQLVSINSVLGDGASSPRSAAASNEKKNSRALTPEPHRKEPVQEVEVKGTRTGSDASDAADSASIWQQFIASIRNEWDKPKVADLRFQSFDGSTIKVAYEGDDASMAQFHRTSGDSLTDLATRILGRTLRVEVDPASLARVQPPQSREQAFEEAAELPFVKQVIQLFDAAIVDVQHAESQPSPTTDTK